MFLVLEANVLFHRLKDLVAKFSGNCIHSVSIQQIKEEEVNDHFGTVHCRTAVQGAMIFVTHVGGCDDLRNTSNYLPNCCSIRKELSHFSLVAILKFETFYALDKLRVVELT